MKNRTIIELVLIIVIFIGIYAGIQANLNLVSTAVPTPTPTKNREIDSKVTYPGRNGVDALTLLKEKAKVEQEASGLISSIKNKKADSSKHEYWAFYVNGKMAEVGPADYKTKNTDLIEWKIEKY